MGPSSIIATAEVSLIDCEKNSSCEKAGGGLKDERNIITVVRYKQISQKEHQNVTVAYGREDSQRIAEKIREDEVHLSDECTCYREEFLKMVSEFQNMFVFQFNRTTVAKHSIMLTLETPSPSTVRPTQVGPGGTKCKKVQTKRARDIDFATCDSACSNRIGSFHRVRSKKLRFLTLLCRLPEVKRSHKTGLVPNSLLGQKHRWLLGSGGILFVDANSFYKKVKVDQAD